MTRDLKSWDLLNARYAEHGVVLAFGAGVSVDCSLPSWIELLSRVGDLCGGGGRQLVEELRAAGFSLPSIAAALKTSCPRADDFAELVREALYKTFPKDLRAVSSRNWRNLVPFVQENNPTLRAVAALCAVPASSGKGYRKNPRVHAIVNFNIDAVFRAYVQARYGDPLLVRTVERSSKSRDPDKINVYYLHGFLRFDRKARDREKEASDKLVITEQEYFDFFNSPTSLFNHTFLYLLREHSCVFIGLSMQDDNIRRLLHYSTAERARAYQEEDPKKDWARKVRRHFVIMRKPAEEGVWSAIERSLAALGAHVLWISHYEEIPERLREMYTRGGDNWRSVY